MAGVARETDKRGSQGAPGPLHKVIFASRGLTAAPVRRGITLAFPAPEP
jgi:hypothetical protein